MTAENVSRDGFARLRQAAEKILKKKKGRVLDTADEELLRVAHELEVHQVELDLQNEELRRALSDLEASRTEFSNLFHSAPVGFLILTEEGEIERYNRAAVDLLPILPRYPAERRFQNLIYSQDLPEYFRTLRDVVNNGFTGAGQTVELRLEPSSGSPFWVRLDIDAEFKGDRAIRFRASILDITARKQGEKALRENEERFRVSFADAAIGFAMTTPEGRFLEANRAYCALTGYTPEELRAMEFPQLIHPDDLAENMERFEKLCSRQIPGFTIENRYIRKDGSAIHVRKSVALVAGLDGNRQWVVAFIEDISDRKLAEESLEANERRFRALTEKTHEFIAVLNDAGKIDYITIGQDNRLHYTPEELTGRDAFELVHPDDTAGARQILQEIVSRPERMRQIEIRVRAMDGAWRWLLVSGTNLLDNPAVNGVVINGIDISDRKENEERIRQIRLDLDRAQEVGQIGSWRMDVHRNILTWSSENYRIFGIPEGEPQSHETFLAAVHPDDSEFVDARWQAALRGEPYEIEHRILAGDRVKWVREKAFLEFDDEGALMGAFGITQDITERREMEEELKRSRDELEERVKERTEKLSHAVKILNRRSNQLRQMAAELTLAENRERQRIASTLHDGLQQLLVGAHFQLENMEQDRNPSDGIPYLKKILGEAVNASRSLVMELHPPVLLRSDLCASLKWLGDWVRDMHGLHVRIKSPESVEPLNHEMFLLLFQSVRELLFNIVKHAGVKKAFIELNQLDEQILLTIEDKGGGFDPSILRLEEGTPGGYGLFGMRERLIIFGVRMQVESAPGKGSRIKLRVPLKSASKKTVREPGIEPASDDGAVHSDRDSQRSGAPGRICIMLADDQDIVRQGIASLIGRESDFLVVGEASDGEAAVRLARQVKPDVVLMDINMPVMDGIRATEIIHGEFPDIRIFGLSMFEDEFHRNDMLKAGAVACLSKRGEAKELINTIRSAAHAESS